MVNMSAKCDEEEPNGLVSILFTKLIRYMLTVTLTFDFQNQKASSFSVVNMSAKFDEEAHIGVVSIVLTSLFQFMSTVSLTIDLVNQ